MTGPDAGGHVAVVSLVPEDASTVLFFTRLSAQLPVRVVQYPGKMAAVLGGARAVILVRGLFECRDVIWLAQLFARHGLLAHTVLAGARTPADLGTDHGGGLVQREVDHLVAHEWARTPEDILWRRTKCGLHMSAAQREAFALRFTNTTSRATSLHSLNTP